MDNEHPKLLDIFKTTAMKSGKTSSVDLLEAIIVYETYPKLEAAIEYLKTFNRMEDEDDSSVYLKMLYEQFDLMDKDGLFTLKQEMINEVIP